MKTKKVPSDSILQVLDILPPDLPVSAPEFESSNEEKEVIHSYPKFKEVEAGLLLMWADAGSLKAEFAVDLKSKAAYFLQRLRVEVLADGKRRRLIGQTELVVALLKCVEPNHKVPVHYLNKDELNGTPTLELHALLKSKPPIEKIQQAVDLCKNYKIKPPTQSQLGAILDKDSSSISKLLKRNSS